MWKLLNRKYMEELDATTSSGGGDVSQKSEGTTTTDTSTTATTKSEGHVWPDDWRPRMVAHITDEGQRAKELKQLERYGSPEDVHKKARALETRLSSGEFKAALPKNATAEQVTTWRKENGIPEVPTGYSLDLGDGVKFVPDDKTAVDEFLKRAHETNQTPDQVKASLKAFHGHLETQKAAKFQKDTEIRLASEEALRSDWGPEFQRNLNLINNLITSKGDEKFIDNFWNARLEDGTPVGSSPAMLKMLLGLALVDNPAGTVIPSSTGNLSQGVDDEIKSIETTMRKDRKSYDKDNKMQERYRELLDARETLKKRNK